MKKATLALAAVGAMALFCESAQAGDFWHNVRHSNLAHRQYQRQVYHGNAHYYPMTWNQHGRLHDSVDHGQYHDYLNHRSYHGSSHGFGIHGRNFSVNFGF